MNIANKEAIELVKKIKDFCENKICGECCFADDIDGHCMITDDAPSNLDIKVFEKQEKELLE